MALIDPPLEWIQNIDAIKPGGTPFKKVATEAERIALRDSGKLVDVVSFIVTLELKPWRKTGFRIVGDIDAEVIQNCIVTLEPFSQKVHEELDVAYLPEAEVARMAKKMEEEGEIVIDVEARDPPEPFSGPEIDIGGLVAEHFALALDDYPRKPGIAFESDAGSASDKAEDGAETKKPSPFAALAAHALAKKNTDTES